MNRPGILLDTGPLVALLNRHDTNHERTKLFFATSSPPFYTCESVVSEACFLVNKIHPAAPEEVIRLGQKGVYEIRFQLKDHWESLRILCKKYQNLPISLADASLIVLAESLEETRIATFDTDFGVYRWNKKRRFTIVI